MEPLYIGPAIFALLERFPLYGGKNVVAGCLKLVHGGVLSIESSLRVVPLREGERERGSTVWV